MPLVLILFQMTLWRGLFGLVWRGMFVAMVLVVGGTEGAFAQLPAPQRTLGIRYLAELPASWRTGLADPLRSVARSLGRAFARPTDADFPLPPDNVFGAESADELYRTMQLGGADLYPIQGYEFVEYEEKLQIKPLLLATRNGRWQTRFFLLACSSSTIQSLHDLKDRTILIHRDGCGNLVDFWLDAAIARGTGVPRKSFARYQTVTEAKEAVLPVFFGEADACVVSEAAYSSVCAQNPMQIPRKLNLTLATSGEFPTQVVACNIKLPPDQQQRVREGARHLTWEFGEQSGGLIVAEELAFDHLRVLLKDRAKSVPGKNSVLPPLSASQLQTSAPALPPVTRP